MQEKKKILLIDDEQDIILLVKTRLVANAYDVVTAHDGQEALEKVLSENPDLIILDVMVPKLDGYKVCKLLKKDKKFDKVPVIILTAKAQNIDKATGTECGADAYVTKPFKPAVLLEKIKELLD